MSPRLEMFFFYGYLLLCTTIIITNCSLFPKNVGGGSKF